MIANVAVILLFQLAGEGLARWFGAPVPGPVIGLALLLAAMIAAPALAARIRETANGLLAHLALLFVPAGVGVVGHLDRFAAVGLEIAAVLVLSTLGAVAVGAGAYLLTARLTGARE